MEDVRNWEHVELGRHDEKRGAIDRTGSFEAVVFTAQRTVRHWERGVGESLWLDLKLNLLLHQGYGFKMVNICKYLLIYQTIQHKVQRK